MIARAAKPTTARQIRTKTSSGTSLTEGRRK